MYIHAALQAWVPFSRLAQKRLFANGELNKACSASLIGASGKIEDITRQFNDFVEPQLPFRFEAGKQTFSYTLPKCLHVHVYYKKCVGCLQSTMKMSLIILKKKIFVSFLHGLTRCTAWNSHEYIIVYLSIYI